MDPEQYKTYHEQSMSDNNGTSVSECGILLSSLPVFVFFASWMSSLAPKALVPFFDFVTIVMPVILSVTIFSGISHIVFTNLVVLHLIITLSSTNFSRLKTLLNTKVQEKNFFVTNYRACTNLVSAVCILAVDFKIFPRRLAKTETFGFGFMDLGVGFFVCCHGLVQKDQTNSNQFIKLLKSCFVFLILGVVRLLSMKSLQYHEHVTEYGIHWNFFFTLMLCRFLVYIILHLANYANPVYLALVTGITHQILLGLGLEKWVLSDIPRNSLFSANREGLTSILGFVSLYFAASSIRRYIFTNYKSYKSLIIKLLVVCIAMWGGTLFCDKTIGISRKLANLGYVFWVIASTLIVIILFIVQEFTILALSEKKKFPNGRENLLLKSINANGLFFFLFSNLLTGVINIFIQTLLLEANLSFIIITIYMAILCGVTYFLYLKQFFVKF